MPPEERIEGYREEIGHNDLADIEAARELQNAEVLLKHGRGNSEENNPNVDDFTSSIGALTSAFDAKSQIEANNEMSDKMVEYTIAQGHKADYTEDNRQTVTSESAE